MAPKKMTTAKPEPKAASAPAGEEKVMVVPKANPKVAAKPIIPGPLAADKSKQAPLPAGSVLMDAAADESRKRKADEAAEGAAASAEAPAPKGAKTAAGEPQQELEVDDLVDKRPVFKGPIGFNTSDTTLNVIPVCEGDVLMSLTHGGLQHFIAGARANIGMKSGRYVFEARVLETLSPSGAAGGTKAPRQLLRIGISTPSSALVLGAGDEEAYFDSEGAFVVGNKKVQNGGKRFARDQVVSVLLNLDETSATSFTMSLFVEGQRASAPQPLPESLRGSTFFPHISFRNLTVHVNLKPQLLKALPFACRAIGAAAQEDVVSSVDSSGKGGKYEVLLPVAFPDEGTFDWLDTFLDQNPGFTELSDRKLLEWAEASGLGRPKYNPSRHSKDKPEFSFGLSGMDDCSVQRVLNSVAGLVPRNYVVMEVKSNLIAEERQETLSKFCGPHFHKVAHVVMGEPNESFKAAQRQRFLMEKRQRAVSVAKAQQQEKKVADIRKKAEEVRKNIAAKAKKKADLVRKRMDIVKRKAAGEDVSTEEAELMAEQAAEEEKENSGMDVDEGDAADDAGTAADGGVGADAGADLDVELTEEEQSRWFRVAQEGNSDLTAAVLGRFFGKFSTPDSQEGFDEIRYEWQDAEASKVYLRKRILERKRSCRLEHLQPGDWFQDACKDFVTKFAQWQMKQKACKAVAAKKDREAAAKKKAKLEELHALGVEEGAVEDDAEAPQEIDPGEVEDILDIGDGIPLFKDFGFEDWALLQLRFELYILQEAFKKDVDDADIAGIHESHLPFYYQKYFKKQLVPKVWGVSSVADIVFLAKESVELNDEEMLVPKINAAVEDDSAEGFVKISEECRRERKRRLDAGDEAAQLRFLPMALQSASLTRPFGAKGIAM